MKNGAFLVISILLSMICSWYLSLFALIILSAILYMVLKLEVGENQFAVNTKSTFIPFIDSNVIIPGLILCLMVMWVIALYLRWGAILQILKDYGLR